jgi:hypothetical protein
VLVARVAKRCAYRRARALCTYVCKPGIQSGSLHVISFVGPGSRRPKIGEQNRNKTSDPENSTMSKCETTHQGILQHFPIICGKFTDSKLGCGEI